MKIEIKNFKSIIKEEIDLDKANILYFVGQNESGKFNFLSAIRNINKIKIEEVDKNFNSSEDVSIEYSWTLGNKIQTKWEEIGYKKNIRIKKKIDIEKLVYYTGTDKNLNKWISTKLSRNYEMSEINIDRVFDIDMLNNLQIKEGLEELELKNQIIDLIKQSIDLRKSILIHSFSDFDLIQKKYSFQEALDSNSFMGLWTLLGQNEEDIKILKNIDKLSNEDDYLDKKSELENNSSIKFKNFINLFWNQNTINFKINIEKDGFTVRAADIFDDNEISNYKSLDYRSDGMKHYLTIVLFINYILKQYPDLNNVVLLDEPDKLLHAGAVMDLRKYLDKISSENMKFIIATHNPILLMKITSMIFLLT